MKNHQEIESYYTVEAKLVIQKHVAVGSLLVTWYKQTANVSVIGLPHFNLSNTNLRRFAI
jgi:hypothetical protein